MNDGATPDRPGYVRPMRASSLGKIWPSGLGSWRLVAVAGVLSCGSGSDTTAIPFSDLKARVLAVVCQSEVDCGAMPDLATCAAALHAERGLYPTLGEDLAAGRISYDAAAAGRCLAALRGLSCSATERFRVNIGENQDCKTTFKGTAAAGGACFFQEECAGGGECARTDAACSSACCPGTCAAPRATVPVGGDCSSSTASCATGSGCARGAASTGMLTCAVLPAQAGADCSQTFACAPPLLCIADAGRATRTCRVYVPSGAGCGDGSVPCDDARDTCDTSTKLCRRRGAVGESCATGTCVAYASCDAATGLCVARAKAGGACSPGCLDGLTCDAAKNLCVGPAPEVPACT